MQTILISITASRRTRRAGRGHWRSFRRLLLELPFGDSHKQTNKQTNNATELTAVVVELGRQQDEPKQLDLNRSEFGAISLMQ